MSSIDSRRPLLTGVDMNTVILVVLPIFALILLGFVCGRTKRLGDQAASELNKLVVWLCLPALLFKVTATAVWAEIWQPGFIVSFGAGAMLVFFATMLWRKLAGKRLVEASVDGLSAAYANTGYIGIPLCVMVLGPQGLQPALISSLIIVCVMFAVGLTFVEIGLQAESNFLGALKSVALGLIKNPLVITPVVGGLWATTGIGLAEPVVTLLDMLAAATTPCALVSLGLFLSKKHSSTAEGAWPLVMIKLFVQPFVTWILAFKVFMLPPLWAHCALLLSALPTGTGPFMVAEYYRMEAGVIAKVILLTTLGSVLTVSACIVWITHTNSI